MKRLLSILFLLYNGTTLSMVCNTETMCAQYTNPVLVIHSVDQHGLQVFSYACNTNEVQRDFNDIMALRKQLYRNKNLNKSNFVTFFMALSAAHNFEQKHLVMRPALKELTNQERLFLHKKIQQYCKNRYCNKSYKNQSKNYQTKQ